MIRRIAKQKKRQKFSFWSKRFQNIETREEQFPALNSTRPLNGDETTPVAEPEWIQP